MALQAMNTGSNPVGVAHGIFTGSGAEIVCPVVVRRRTDLVRGLDDRSSCSHTSPGQLHDGGAQPHA